MPSPFMFAYFSTIIPLASGSDQAHIWRIAINAFLVSVVISYVAAAHDGLFISRTFNPRIAEEWLAVVVPLVERSVRLIEQLGLLVVIIKSNFDLALVFVAFCGRKEVEWDQVDLLDSFQLYIWWTGKVFGLCEKRVHERKCQPEGPSVFHGRQIPANRVNIRSCVRRLSTEDDLTAAQAAF